MKKRQQKLEVNCKAMADGKRLVAVLNTVDYEGTHSYLEAVRDCIEQIIWAVETEARPGDGDQEYTTLTVQASVAPERRRIIR